MSENGSARDPLDEQEHLAELVLEPDDGQASTRGSTIAVALLGVIGLVALVVGAANLRSDDTRSSADGSQGIEVDRTQPNTVDLSPAGPRDGLESLRLPITVGPSESLLDGQVVSITGSQFPPNNALGVVMCSGAIDLGGGSAQCQLSPYTSAQSDADGNFSVEYPVRRIIVVGGEVIDCADPVPEGLDIPSTCVVAVGAISDYDQSGVFPVTFDASAPTPPMPTIEVSPSEGLVDGDMVTVTVDGVDDDWGWWPSVCTSADRIEANQQGQSDTEGEFGPHTGEYGRDLWCEPFGGLWLDHVNAGPAEAAVSRWFGSLSGMQPIDCGAWPGRCWIEVHAGPLPIDPVPLVFDPSVPAPPPPPPPTYDEWGHLVTESDDPGGSGPTETTVEVP